MIWGRGASAPLFFCGRTQEAEPKYVSTLPSAADTRETPATSSVRHTSWALARLKPKYPQERRRLLGCDGQAARRWRGQYLEANASHRGGAGGKRSRGRENRATRNRGSPAPHSLINAQRAILLAQKPTHQRKKNRGSNEHHPLISVAFNVHHVVNKSCYKD